MIIKITHVTLRQTVNLELITSDTESHSYLDDNPFLKHELQIVIHKKLEEYIKRQDHQLNDR